MSQTQVYAKSNTALNTVYMYQQALHQQLQTSLYHFNCTFVAVSCSSMVYFIFDLH